MTTFMKTLLLLVPLLLLSMHFVLAQPRDIDWSRVYGGPNDDQGSCVQQTYDGGFIITGYITPPGRGSQILLMKTNSNGDSLWAKTYGDTITTFASGGRCVRQTTDGGYIIVGDTYYNTAGLTDGWLIKTDSLGTIEWDTIYGGPDYDGFASVIQTVDGGYLVTGYTSMVQKDLLLLKTDGAGNIEWDTTYYGGADEVGNCIIATTDGGFVIVGATSTFGHYGTFDVWLLKIDSLGDTLWTQTYGGPRQHDHAACVRQTPDGGYIIAASAAAFGDSLAYDGWLIKTNAVGDCTWSMLYGNFGEWDTFNSVMVTDSGYIIVGSAKSGLNNYLDAWTIKTDDSGQVVWESRLDAYGLNDVFYCIDSISDQNCVMTGYTSINHPGNTEVWLVYLDYTLGTILKDPPNKIPDSFNLQSPSPNPFNASTTIPFSLPTRSHVELSVYDLAGRRVAVLADDWMNPGSYQATFDAAALPSGVYLCRLRAGEFSAVTKIVLLK